MIRRAGTDIPREAVADLCKRWHVSELSLFDPTLFGETESRTEVAALVRFSSGSQWSLFDLAEMESELGRLLARSVEVVTRSALETNNKPVMLAAILNAAEPVYAE